jgi:tRNA threonylcarbamoyladenosine biosynthesis protein TsaE
MEENELNFLSLNPEQTRRIGASLGKSLQHGDMICLQGDLGAGKTTFVQGVARGWGSLDSVSSPTFIIVNEYRHAEGKRLFHMDAYRLDSAPEAEEIDIDSMLADGALLLEWPERMDGLVPVDNLWISITYSVDEQREMLLKACGKRYEELLVVIRNAMDGNS